MGSGWLAGVLPGAFMPPLFYLSGTELLPPYLLGLLLILFAVRFLRGEELAGALPWVSERLLGVVYIAVPLSYLIVLRETPLGPWWILFVFIVIWANDTFAYYVGRALGRKKLCPKVSPGKTVEGAAGGLLGGVLAAVIFVKFAELGMAPAVIVACALLLGALGIAGDLVESVLKRGAGVKDSGSIIPGHGGVLDRLDSTLFAVPAMYYCVIWLL